MKRVVITGGAGFIGSNFINKIIKGEDYIVNIDSETYASINKTSLNFEKYAPPCNPCGFAKVKPLKSKFSLGNSHVSKSWPSNKSIPSTSR